MAGLVKNGDFKQYSLGDNGYIYSAQTQSNLHPGWDFKLVGNAYTVLGNGHCAFGTELPYKEQCLIVQHGTVVNSTTEASQNIKFKRGSYELTFKTRHRNPIGGYYSPLHRLYVSILNNKETVLSKTEVPLSGSWQTKIYKFDVLTPGEFKMCFTFDVPAGAVPGDTTIFLTNVNLKYIPPPIIVRSCDTFTDGYLNNTTSSLSTSLLPTQQDVATNNKNSYNMVFSNNISNTINPVSDYYNFRKFE